MHKRSKGSMARARDVFIRMEPWSIDMWSLGVILLEIMTGFPVWLSYKGKMRDSNSKTRIATGVFGVSGRNVHKIVAKQHKLVANLFDTVGYKYDTQGLERNEGFVDLLMSLLCLNPKHRLAPQEALDLIHNIV